MRRQRIKPTVVASLPNRCPCRGDGATWVDTSGCPVHDLQSSPLAQAVVRGYEAGRDE